MRSQGGVHVAADSEHLALLEERHVLGDGRAGAQPELLRAGDRILRRQAAILVLLEGEGRPSAGQLALNEGHLVGPGVGQQLNVRQVPVVVLDPHARGAGLRRRLLLQPADEAIRRIQAALNSRGERRMCVHSTPLRTSPGFGGQVGEDRPLFFHAADAVNPEIAGVASEVAARLLQECGHRREPCSELAGFLRGERELPSPQLDGAERIRALAGRLIALVRHDADVEGRISRPWLQDAMVEIQPVHLCAQDMEIDLLCDGPRARIESGETSPIAGKLGLLRGHRGGRVVGNSVDQLGFLEGAPFGKE